MNNYNKILLTGNCETCKRFFMNILKSYDNIIYGYNELFYIGQKLDIDVIKFLNQQVPKGKILLNITHHTRILNNLNPKLENWRIIYIHRDLIDTYGSYTVKTGKHLHVPKLFDICEEFTYFYLKHRNKTIKVEYRDLFNHPLETTKSVFKFLELPFLRDELIQLIFDKSFEHERFHITKPGFEFFEMVDTDTRKEIVDQIMIRSDKTPFIKKEDLKRIILEM